MKAILRLISTNPNGGIRNPGEPVEGVFHLEPTEGQSFRFYGDALEMPDGIRIINTSPIKTVSKQGEKSFTFSTQNSLYVLELRPDLQ
jgi:hypothetical protein